MVIYHAPPTGECQYKVEKWTERGTIDSFLLAGDTKDVIVECVNASHTSNLLFDAMKRRKNVKITIVEDD